jgi:response regulator RpfG family c-di-GMP phosphodiesterase
MDKDIILVGSQHLSRYENACKGQSVNIKTTDDMKSTLTSIQEKTPNLILVDHECLGPASVEICQTLKKFPGTQRIPVLYITPRDATQHLLEVLDIPVDDYVFLPLDLEDFQARMQAQLELQSLKETKKLASVEEKLEELEKLLQIFPDYNAARQELAEIYEKVGRIEDALKARLDLAREYYQQNNTGLAMDVIAQMKTMLAKQNVSFANYTKFVEALERCDQFLKPTKE